MGVGPLIEISFFEVNLRPVLETVGSLANHRFDEDDWIAVSNGIKETDAEADIWYDYEFYETCRIPFHVAFDASGGSIVRFRVDLAAEFESRIHLLGDFCWHYHWRHPGDQK